MQITSLYLPMIQHYWSQAVDRFPSLRKLLGKTERILFGSNKKIRKQSTMKITCGENEVAAKDNLKYLGVSLDQSLGGKYIAENLKKRVTPDSNFYGDKLNI